MGDGCRRLRAVSMVLYLAGEDAGWKPALPAVISRIETIRNEAYAFLNGGMQPGISPLSARWGTVKGLHSTFGAPGTVKGPQPQG